MISNPGRVDLIATMVGEARPLSLTPVNVVLYTSVMTSG